MNLVKQGDRIRVIAPSYSFGDYDIGSTAEVRSAESDGVNVRWEAPFFCDGRDAERCTYLRYCEFEVIGRAQSRPLAAPPALLDLASAGGEP
ncbi:hypothetical protein [Lysobacter sp. Root96]|uniref:hypothetical protein n=1 Tax=Lysobacter sp. Root96 TaxID=1736612 RepID=UPI0006F93560|nr:hypothetical protein [Lysobacter sp. Root96]KRD71408.1 hypothetical protein ASE45_06250 [Lysobacter sp. Root96]